MTFVSSTMITDYPDIMDAEEYAQYKERPIGTEQQENTQRMLLYLHPEELTYLEKGYDTNYRDMLMHNGFNQNYEVSVSGGKYENQT